nr:hypothetical protein [uncultured Cohaesibacter sp.]
MFHELFDATRLFITCLPAASRVANAVEMGSEPSIEDLKKLDLQDLYRF